MATETRMLPDACREHVDKINKALADDNADQAFYLAYQYFRARVRNCQQRRPQDADGFRRYAAHWLAALAGEVHGHHPADEFRFGVPLIPGGNAETR
jgi:hypothetical protein